MCECTTCCTVLQGYQVSVRRVSLHDGSDRLYISPGSSGSGPTFSYTGSLWGTSGLPSDAYAELHINDSAINVYVLGLPHTITTRTVLTVLVPRAEFTIGYLYLRPERLSFAIAAGRSSLTASCHTASSNSRSPQSHVPSTLFPGHSSYI